MAVMEIDAALPSNWKKVRDTGEHLIFRRQDFDHYVAVRNDGERVLVVLMTDATGDPGLPLEAETTSSHRVEEAVVELTTASNAAIPS